MATIITRETGATAKGSPLTNAEVDNNFINLNTEVTPSRPTIRPTLNLDFANSKSVDPRITFTRSSAATYYDENGILQTIRDNKPRIDFDPVTGECKGLLIEEQRTNLFTQGERFASGWSRGQAATWVRDSAIAPDGTMTALGVDGLSGTSRTFSTGAAVYATSVAVSASTAYTVSFYVRAKSGTASNICIRINESLSGDVINNVYSPGYTVGTEWTRISLTVTTSVSTTLLGVTLGTLSGSANVYMWGAQLEQGAFATSYIPSTITFTSRASSATYFDSTGVLRTAGVDQARYGYGYDSVNGKWVSQGLVLESAATNLFDSSIGTLTQLASTTVTPNALTAPDGSLTAQRVTASSNYVYKYLPSVVGGGVVHTMSFFVKPVNNVVRFAVGGTAGSMSYVLDFSTSTPGITFSNGSNATNYGSSLTSVGNSGWWRFTGTFSFSGSAGYTEFQWSFSGGTNLDAYLWGMQIETGSVATSYIPTYGSAATRAADVSSSAATTRSIDKPYITNGFTDWFNSTEGSIYVEPESSSIGVNRLVYAFDDNSGSSSTQLMFTSTGTRGFYSTGAADLGVTAPQANVYFKNASAYKKNDFACSTDGAINSDTSGDVAYNMNRLVFGQTYDFASSNNLNGHIKKLAYYTKRLSNTKLQALTK